jgi:hypothetical protein
VWAAADPTDGKSSFYERSSIMCEKNDNPKSDASNEKKSEPAPVAVGLVAGTVGFVVGTLVAGPALGIAFALIWGAQAAICEATGHEVTSQDVS